MCKKLSALSTEIKLSNESQKNMDCGITEIIINESMQQKIKFVNHVRISICMKLCDIS